MTLITNWSVNKNIIIPFKKSNKRKKGDDETSNTSDLLNIISKKESTQENIYTLDNNIYFQSDITLDTISELNKEIRILGSELSSMARDYGIDSPVIKLHITSYGGCVHAALSAIDCIEASKVPVHTIIDGYAASAATMISICGKKRYIRKNASMLIHQLRAGAWGKMTEIEDDFSNLQKTHALIKKIYIEHTKINRKDLTNILKHDLDWNPEECLKNGLVDEII
jgi:ATP-dependent protease ClpP protease subunit